MLSHSLGYPRIGDNRELKKATESYWAGRSTQADLQAAAKEIRRVNWLKQRELGIDLVPSNDFSFYDSVLDISCLVGNVPPRFNHKHGTLVDLDTRFAIARGVSPKANDHGEGCAPGCEHGISTNASGTLQISRDHSANATRMKT